MVNLIDNEVLQAFATYATIVVLKMLMMAPMTAYFRITRKAFANPEDAGVHGKTPEDKKKMIKTDPDVERVRSITRCVVASAVMVTDTVPSLDAIRMTWRTSFHLF
ncbi:microsomal glutathione S-transferase 1-like isoform X2 [Alosa pseudoharengus]|uniref:microsomal glutathione S-transferase 1-like isoform X2 n=1 Tax=Alosa pseudoharengus TaxID=34774 RepID=UPI003F8C94EA